MPYNSRDPNAASTGFSLAANHGLALLVVGAVVVLFLLRHFYGAVEVGTK